MVLLYFFAAFGLFSVWYLPLSNAQASNGSCTSNVQPIVTRIDPPSGTTGRDVRESTNYTITGSQLNRVNTIIVYYPGGMLMTRDVSRNGSTAIRFRIENGRFNRVNATVSVIPANSDCLAVNLTVLLFSECK